MPAKRFTAVAFTYDTPINRRKCNASHKRRNRIEVEKAISLRGVGCSTADQLQRLVIYYRRHASRLTMLRQTGAFGCSPALDTASQLIQQLMYGVRPLSANSARKRILA